MGGMFTLLFAKIAAVVKWFADLFVSVFVSVWDMVKDAFSWLFEQVLTVAISAVGAIDTSALSGLGGWGSIPGDILNVLGLLGVGTAVSIISAAILIRIALQLIPFVRLGS